LYRTRGNIFIHAGNWQPAAEEFEETAVVSDPSGDDWCSYARAETPGTKLLAVQQFSKAVDADPEIY
jgi:hypothetical protein